jgi:hypothetical protein
VETFKSIITVYQSIPKQGNLFLKSFKVNPANIKMEAVTWFEPQLERFTRLDSGLKHQRRKLAGYS